MPTTGPNGQISDFSLKISYWYVTHKKQLKTALVVFLVLLNITFYGFSLYQATMILFINDANFRQYLRILPLDLVDYQFFHEKNQPLDLEMLSFEAHRTTGDKYDFIANLSNPNKSWMADRVVLQLTSGGEVVEQKDVFIYPQEEKYVAFFNKADINPGLAAISIAEVNWQRLQDFEGYSVPRLNFEVSEPIFTPADQFVSSGDLPVSSLKFKIKNATAYSYWQVGIYMVLLSSQGDVGGLNYFALDQFKSGEERTVEMRWYEALPPISEVLILPEVDIYDPAVYMRVE